MRSNTDQSRSLAVRSHTESMGCGAFAKWLATAMTGVCAFVLASPGAHATTLLHNDLVALQGSNLIRIDTQTGAQELIATAVPAGDIAVTVGGSTVYAVGGDTLSAIDPASGLVTTVASGFDSADGVAIGPGGDIYVLDNPTSGAVLRPSIYRVDPGTGARELIVESNLTPTGGPPGATATWWGRDLEILANGSLAVLGQALPGDAPFGGVGGMSGVVGIDLASATESILFTNETTEAEFGRLFLAASALGIDDVGRIVVGADQDRAGNAFAYDIATGALADLGSLSVVVDPLGGPDALLGGAIDFATTPDGSMWASGAFGYPVTGDAQLIGVHPVVRQPCPTCADGFRYVPLLVDGEAFSQGLGITEIQPVVIPEPSTLLLVGVGLGALALRLGAGNRPRPAARFPKYASAP